jgi:glycosyltransferase involved in cell wall biosynthesis
VVDSASILIAIPALNEQATISKILADVKRQYPLVKILVINDGSSDQTSHKARIAGATVLDMPFNVGVGGAMRAAFQYALENSVDYVIQFDADGQHAFESIQTLISVVNSADIVVGTRFNNPKKFKMGVTRMIAISFLRIIVRYSTGTSISDPTSGFRSANQKAMKIFVDGYPTSYLGDTVGSLILAGQSQLKISEVDVVMHERQGGTASQNWAQLPLHLLRVALMGILFLVRRKNNRKRIIE